MALAPYFAGRTIGPPTAPNVVEAYLDYVCPFSKRLFERIVADVAPGAEKEHGGKVRFVFRHQVQPWHPQSTLVHEAAIAVGRLHPDGFVAFSKLLFERQTDFFDLNVFDKSRQQVYTDLAALAGQIGADPAAVLKLLDRKPSEEFLNTGNAVTDELKIHIRIARQNGIHVSPTVLFNGLVDNAVSSGWTPDQWREYLAAKL
ncbi:thioredoxin-like protein [Hyaloraphidium curvatum]|nr:thioredoxin-like protein [Hyaloraphidium curvatum]